jgi:hypothetical protein
MFRKPEQQVAGFFGIQTFDFLYFKKLVKGMVVLVKRFQHDRRSGDDADIRRGLQNLAQAVGFGVVHLAGHIAEIVDKEQEFATGSGQFAGQPVEQGAFIGVVVFVLRRKLPPFGLFEAKIGMFLFEQLHDALPEIEQAADAVFFFVEYQGDKPRIQRRVVLDFISEPQQQGGFAHAPAPQQQVMLLRYVHFGFFDDLEQVFEGVLPHHKTLDELGFGLYLRIVDGGDAGLLDRMGHDCYFMRFSSTKGAGWVN